MLRFLTPHVETLCVVLDILLITPFILECLLTFDSGQQVIFTLKEHSRLKTKNRLREVSLFSSDLVRGVHARASVERLSRETQETRAAAREEKRETARLTTQNTIG